MKKNAEVYKVFLKILIFRVGEGSFLLWKAESLLKKIKKVKQVSDSPICIVGGWTSPKPESVHDFTEKWVEKKDILFSELEAM